MRSFGLEKFIAHIVGPSSSDHQKLYLPIISLVHCPLNEIYL